MQPMLLPPAFDCNPFSAAAPAELLVKVAESQSFAVAADKGRKSNDRSPHTSYDDDEAVEDLATCRRPSLALRAGPGLHPGKRRASTAWELRVVERH